MKSLATRRRFLQQSAAVTLAGLGDFRFLGNLPPISAQDVKVQPKRVQFGSDIEPLVRLDVNAFWTNACQKEAAK